MPFQSNITQIYKEHGKEWLASLQSFTKQIEKEWGLSNLIPLENLSYNYVLSGYRGKQPIIVKHTINPKDLHKELLALTAFSQYGAVQVLEAQEDTLLLERAVPGASLESLPHTEALKIAIHVVKRLLSAPIKPYQEIEPIENILSILDKEWPIPEELLNKARNLRDRLLKKSLQNKLLHGDLHYGNILKNGENWVVIDPKGIIGDPINEVYPLIRDIEKDPKEIADSFGWPLEYVQEWYFVHVVVACIWNIEDSILENPFLDRAKQAYKIFGW